MKPLFISTFLLLLFQPASWAGSCSAPLPPNVEVPETGHTSWLESPWLWIASGSLLLLGYWLNLKRKRRQNPSIKKGNSQPEA